MRTHLIHRPARDILPLLGGFRVSSYRIDLMCPSCCYGFPGPAELGAVNPDAVQDHGQPARQGHDRLFHPAAPGDLHGPGLKPGPFLRTQHALRSFVDGVAPSYFIEGMLHNVPNDKFGKTLEDTFVATFNYIINADRSEFKCANGKLLGTSPVTWRAADCQTLLDGLKQLWTNGMR
jgi:hypothetical protein